MSAGRGITIARDALGNTLITGDNNIVVIQANHEIQEVSRETSHIGTNPYKGLASFDERDAQLFFGREELIAQLSDSYRSLCAPVRSALRVLSVLGPSGSGKSSVVRAGLIPELATIPLHNHKTLHVAVFTPGSSPIQSLGNALAQAVTSDQIPISKARELSEELRILNNDNQYDGLVRITATLPRADSSALVLVVDEFQEIYSLCKDKSDCDAFVGNLLHAAADPAGIVSVILTLRSDFLGETQHHPILNKVIAEQGVIVPALDTDGLMRAISEPAKYAGCPIDDATIELLISQVAGRGGALPLLQFALSQIWVGMNRGEESAKILRDLGGVGGALAHEAQSLYENCSDADKKIVRRTFMALVQLGEGVQDTRRRVKLSDIVTLGEDKSHVQQLLGLFAHPSKRLITLSTNPEGEITVELTHEVLIQNWIQLRRWLDSNRDDIRFHRRLADAARNWADLGKPNGSLSRPPELDLLIDFQERTANPLTILETEFLEAGVDLRSRDLEIEEFVQSQKMQAVGQLAGGVAHEFNNLLTAMIVFSDLLLLRHSPGDQSFGDIMQIKQNANRIAQLVRQLLAFSRQQTLLPRVLSITDVLGDLTNLLRRLIGANIKLNIAHGRDLGLVRVDQGQLEQVVINLAVNARDAMVEGGELTVRTFNETVIVETRRGNETVKPGDYVVVEMSDNGSGIPLDIQERIFEPFFTTKEVGAGTGLGLSTVYGIVKQTGGQVFLDSAPGAGAKFTILIPRHQAEASDDVQISETAESAVVADTTGTGTILLVEDENAVRLFSARALRAKGYKVLEARTGEAALELLGVVDDFIDLMITEVSMPEMDGLTLIVEMHKTRPDLPVICISGYVEETFREKLGESDDIHFLPKPFSLDQLAGKVKDVMSLPRSS